MLTMPQIMERPAVRFVGIELTLSQPQISELAPPLVDDVIRWAEAKGATLVGRSFFNYVSFLPDGRMTMQVCMPLNQLIPGEGRIITGIVPAGQFASLVATVPYDQIHSATMTLMDWAKEQNIEFDGEETEEGFSGATRLEIYHKDPGEDPSGNPVTEIAFRLKQ